MTTATHFLLSTMAVLALLATGVAHCETPASPAQWKHAAAEDLAAIHDILRDNSPAMIVSRDSAQFRRWLDQGYRSVRLKLADVRDAGGYRAVMQFYVKGFRDGHINWHFTDRSIDTQPHAWTGFSLRWQPDGYSVVYRKPNMSAIPALGAHLVSCDGHSAAEIAQQHDRYAGNLQLDSGRYWSAPELLFDRDNPFIKRPTSCKFMSEGQVHRYRLRWQPLEKGEYNGIYAALGLDRKRTLGLQRWGKNAWWMTVPSMGSNQNWKGFFASVEENVTAIRSADNVVIDLRGNQGGDSSFGDRLAAILWGEEFANSHQPQLGPVIWRVTRLNRDFWADLTAKANKDPELADADRKEFQRVLARYDAALAKGEPTFRDGADASLATPPAGPDRMRGHVVLLTDYACASACLDLMDHFLAMPRVVQAGTPTGADTIFMELTRVPQLPSGIAGFGFGHKAYIERPRGSNQSYRPRPALTWHGAANDESGLRDWLRTAAFL